MARPGLEPGVGSVDSSVHVVPIVTGRTPHRSHGEWHPIPLRYCEGGDAGADAGGRPARLVVPVPIATIVGRRTSELYA